MSAPTDVLTGDGCDVCDAPAGIAGTCILCDDKATTGVCDTHAKSIRTGRVPCWPWASKLVTAAKALGYAPKQGDHSILPRKEVLAALGLDHDRKGTTLERAGRIVRFVDEHPEELPAIRNRSMRSADDYARAFMARIRSTAISDTPTASAADTIRHMPAEELLSTIREEADGIVTDPPYTSPVLYGRLAEGAVRGAVKVGAPVCVILPEDVLADVLDVMRAAGMTFTGRALALDCRGRDGRRTVGRGLSYWRLALVFTRGPRLTLPIVTKVLKSAGKDRRWHEQGLDVPLVVQLLDALRLPANGLILDPYAGSGSVAVACRHRGLRCIASEIDEERVKRARYRFDHPELETFALSADRAGQVRGAA